MKSLLATVAFLAYFSKAIHHIEKYLYIHGLSQQMEIWQHSRSHPAFLLSQILQLHTNLVIGGYPLLHISEDQQKKTRVDMSAKCFIMTNFARVILVMLNFSRAAILGRPFEIS